MFSFNCRDPLRDHGWKFLPKDDLLFYERAVSMAAGMAGRLRLIPGKEIRPRSIMHREAVLKAPI
jgi:hypothetical protein